MVINITQELRIHLFLINRFVNKLDISSTKDIFLKIFNSEFSYIEVWITWQNSKPLEIEANVYIILGIN